MSIMYGLIYFRLEVNQEGIQNINGVLFMFLINSTFGVLYTVVNVNIFLTFLTELKLNIKNETF